MDNAVTPSKGERIAELERKVGALEGRLAKVERTMQEMTGGVEITLAPQTLDDLGRRP